MDGTDESTELCHRRILVGGNNFNAAAVVVVFDKSILHCLHFN